MKDVIFLVQGSSVEPYEVTFIKDESSLTALCTCPAGQFGNFCKHRIAILDGKVAAISSSNVDQVQTVVEWLVGTDVEAALVEMREAEKIADNAKKNLAALKKKLAKAMNS